MGFADMIEQPSRISMPHERMAMQTLHVGTTNTRRYGEHRGIESVICSYSVQDGARPIQ